MLYTAFESDNSANVDFSVDLESFVIITSRKHTSLAWELGSHESTRKAIRWRFIRMRLLRVKEVCDVIIYQRLMYHGFGTYIITETVILWFPNQLNSTSEYKYHV